MVWPAYAGSACTVDLEMDGPGRSLPLRLFLKQRREGKDDDDVDRRRGNGDSGEQRFRLDAPVAGGGPVDRGEPIELGLASWNGGGRE